jgi:hypothetical protein
MVKITKKQLEEARKKGRRANLNWSRKKKKGTQRPNILEVFSLPATSNKIKYYGINSIKSITKDDINKFKETKTGKDYLKYFTTKGTLRKKYQTATKKTTKKPTKKTTKK